MLRGLFTAAAGMTGMSFEVDNIANNLANVNTFGYKRTRVDFQDLLYQTLRPAGTSVAAGVDVPAGIQVGHGVRVAATRRVFTEGSYRSTENPLDLAILGKNGFFQVQLPDGTLAYTRDGAFSVDQTGTIVTSDGYILQPQITIPQDTVAMNVSEEGIVTVIQGRLTDAPNELGTIQLATFFNPAGLHADGNNIFLETAASGPVQLLDPGTDGAGKIAQGFLENSNVNIAEELVNHITAQRAFEVNSRAVRSSDSMLQTAVNLAQ
ncbi:MAG TPA: flagellar basal-body rod protein FlgG [bacterium]|nr:flagellar basal-body rod protein FlgG [bacterium]